jgi:nitrite reductase/ring-hydroxylating ferredoxin subunit
MYRNKKLLEIVRQFSCQNCGIQDNTVVAAHSNQLRDGKGKGIKAHDYRIASLCHKCHYEIDQGKKLSKEERIEFWEAAHRKTIACLFEQGFLHTKV